jgi:hypothetical protein
MPRIQDELIRARGTRFRLYPQTPVLESIRVRGPETVWVSPPPGSIGPGPSDDRMYVADAIEKSPYGYPYLPPHRGPENPRVPPGRDGHFDYLAPDDHGFLAAHMYGTVRRVLDIWEGYLGRPIVWHFRDRYEQLELVPLIDWDNSHAGYGFLETGYGEAGDGTRHPYSLNFDVLAHEVGHTIIYAEVGAPPLAATTAEYYGFQESAADLVALVGALHFDSVVDRLLRDSHGNLYAPNEVGRIAELSETRQIRMASHDYRMSDVPDPRTPPAELTQPEIHHLGEPLTGAVFDIFVEIFQADLVAAGLISEDLAALSYGVPDDRRLEDAVARGFARAYQGRHAAFRAVLLDARDYLGALLVETWTRLSPHFLRYADIAGALIAGDRALTGGRRQRIIGESLAWREIDLPMDGRWRLARHGIFY